VNQIFCRRQTNISPQYLGVANIPLGSSRRAHALWPCRACRTAWLDTLILARSTRRTCRVETWRDEPSGIWTYSVTPLLQWHTLHCVQLVSGVCWTLHSGGMPPLVHMFKRNSAILCPFPIFPGITFFPVDPVWWYLAAPGNPWPNIWGYADSRSPALWMRVSCERMAR